MTQSNTASTAQEVLYNSAEKLISTTDLKGIITYANENLCRITGHDEQTLVGKSHQIIRHPDMPHDIFSDLWSKIKEGEAWRGMVKNRCKDGRYYWADTYITALYDNGEHIGYQSVQVMPNQMLKDRASNFYNKMNNGKSAQPSQLFVKYRQHLSLLFIALFIFHLFQSNSLNDALLSVSLLIAVFLCNYQALVVTPQQLKKLSKRFDSPSRYIYEGMQPFNIVGFYIGLLQTRISTILTRTSDATREHYSLSKKLNEISQLTLLDVSEGEKELGKLTLAIEKMSMTAQEIGQSTVQAKNQTKEALQCCVQAQQQVQKSTDTMTMMSLQIQSVSGDATQLSRSIEVINSATEAIKDIAKRTHLLTAKTAEPGRDFSVIANDIQSLFNDANTATQSIQLAVGEMQKTLALWIEKIDSSQQQVDKTLNASTETQLLTQQVAMMIANINDISLSISTVAEKQSMVSSTLVENVANIYNLSKHNKQQAHDLHTTSVHLSKKSKSISELSSQFSQ